jgi:hypothetical protein
VPEQGLAATPAVEAPPDGGPIEPEVAAAVTAFATAPAVAGPVAALRSPGTVSPAPVVAPLGAASIEAPAGLAAPPDVGGVELASDPGALAEVAALMSPVPSVEAQAPGRPLAVAGGGSLQLSVGGEVWDVAEARRFADAPVHRRRTGRWPRRPTPRRSADRPQRPGPRPAVWPYPAAKSGNGRPTLRS